MNETIIEEKKEPVTFILSGPLSVILCKALNKIYRKEGDEENVSLESKQMQISTILNSNRNHTPKRKVNIFAIPMKKLSASLINQVVDIIADNKTELILYLDENVDFVGSLDNTPASNLNGKYSLMTKSLEDYSLNTNVKVVTNMTQLTEYLDSNYLM